MWGGCVICVFLKIVEWECFCNILLSGISLKIFKVILGLLIISLCVIDLKVNYVNLNGFISLVFYIYGYC